MIKVMAVTGNRADYGLMSLVYRDMLGLSDISLQLVVTGAHLMQGYGDTLAAIRADGIEPAALLDMQLTGDDGAASVRALGHACQGFAATLESLLPDIVMLAGDRYELLAPAQAALLMRVPILHIFGGDITLGALDDAVRNAISMMADWHCTATASARNRLIGMGIDPERVVATGSPSLDHMLRTPRIGREALLHRLGVEDRGNLLAVTMHPATMLDHPIDELDAMLEGLAALPQDTFTILITAPNQDPAGQAFRVRIEEFVARQANASLHPSLGQMFYLSLVDAADAVVGNSSSALYEAPALQTPSIDIGIRQTGRERASSVLHVEAEPQAIHDAVLQALAMDCHGVVSPYGDGHSAGRILDVVRRAYLTRMQ